MKIRAELPSAYAATAAAWYDKYGLELLPMIHIALTKKHSTTTWTDIYDPQTSAKREKLLKALKDEAARKKRDELGGAAAAANLLTEDKLRAWLEAGETYSSISYKHTGLPTVKIAAAAKAYGLQSSGRDAYKDKPLPIDPAITEYCMSTSTPSIIAALYNQLLGEETQAPTPQSHEPEEPTGPQFTGERLAALIEEHKTYKAVAEILGISVATVSDFCKLYGIRSTYKPMRRFNKR